MNYRKFLVRLPSGDRYWTVVDSCYRPVSDADEWLLSLRLARDCAESTTEAYAGSLALFLQWCAITRVDWREASSEFGRFVLWLRYYQPDSPGSPITRVVRGERRINAVTSAVREFLKHAAAMGLIERGALDCLYRWAEPRGVPVDVLGEGPRQILLRPRHRLREPEREVDAVTDDEVLALFKACQNARDRFIVLAAWRVGLRRGELTGLRMEDCHLLPSSALLGCDVAGSHFHVRRRPNPNRAMAKSRRSRAVPADWLVVQAFDQYMLIRNACRTATKCDFLLVNLFREPVGAPMRPGAINELFEALSKRARVDRAIHPHMFRHAFGTNIAASGSTLDELKELLGHAYISSSQIYLHPSEERLRAAVDRVASLCTNRPGETQ